MSYSIKTAAAKIGLSPYTLRFYDKAGLLPFVARDHSGYRAFTDGDLMLLQTIKCLKDTGMPIAQIQTYIQYVMAGPSTVDQRADLLKKQRQAVVEKQKQLAASLKEIDRKLDIYTDPKAQTLVAQEIAAASSEKAANGLASAFKR